MALIRKRRLTEQQRRIEKQHKTRQEDSILHKI
jgi:hypothetical protein